MSINKRNQGIELLRIVAMLYIVVLHIVISWLSPATFGVYLFHMQWDVVENVIIGRFKFIADMKFWQIPLCILGIASVIMLIGIFIDKLRGYLFKIIKVDEIAEGIEKKISKYLRCLCEKELNDN